MEAAAALTTPTEARSEAAFRIFVPLSEASVFKAAAVLTAETVARSSAAFVILMPFVECVGVGIVGGADGRDGSVFGGGGV